ncbi:MAG: hypothetical protein VKS61_12265 [Candidatus Sericytochromatia bacterium]|nr:hypothetical protein [Candidatus Sericytochromatia bacterium]
MRVCRSFETLLGGALLGAALSLSQPEPALACGPLAHAVSADRAFAQMVSRQPWLAPFRDAFIWGAVAPDVHEAPGAGHLSRARTHAPSTLASLWRGAPDATGRAFVLGWAAHMGADADAEASAARDLCLDAALLPGASQQLQAMAVAAWRHSGGAAGAAVQGVLLHPLGLDAATYTGWASLTAAMAGRGPDRYLRERARFLRLERDLDRLRSPEARETLGDPAAIIAEASQAARQAVERLLGGAAPQAPSARSGCGRAGRAVTALSVRETLIRPKP